MTFFCDFLVEDLIVVELKSVTEFNDIHRSQILNYINLMK
ncbi:MAG: GxxExxY protein, partial [Chryseobacterium sp.]|nr:GxxExxY protein [Chryseobacterium sp.]